MTLTRRIMEKTDGFSARNYNRYPVAIVWGSGAWVKDAEGSQYLDMLSAYSAVNIGHCHPRVTAAIAEQAQKLMVISGNYYNDKHAELCKVICRLCNKDRVLFSSGGAESVETAIKISRKWGYFEKRIPGMAEIITADKNFHGRTVTILSSSPVKQYRDGFGPFTLGFEKVVRFGDPDEMGRAITENTAAFLVEPIAGEGGMHVPPDGYLKEIEKICRKNNVLLVLDEIQTGFGRTGTDFACQYEGVNPDILIIGKSLGGGMPISAVLTDEHIMRVIGPGDHGSTFGGNPLCCAAALASIEVLYDERLAERSRELGNYFISNLKLIRSELIKEVRGRGLFIGVELKTDADGVHKFCEKLLKEGVLCTGARDNTVRFTPPLVIKRVDIDWALDKIENVLRAP